MSDLPILYSFRRCPYAMRARMAIVYAGIPVVLREMLLKNKPPAMLQASPKGTVPVLVLPNGRVLEQSRDIMCWALSQNDPDDWRYRKNCTKTMDAEQNTTTEIVQLVNANDNEFKPHLDRYKYADRYPHMSAEQYRSRGDIFLAELNRRLTEHQFLVGDRISLADIAIFPFARQFALVDRHWFDNTPHRFLQRWLEYFMALPLFETIMQKHPVWLDTGQEVII